MAVFLFITPENCPWYICYVLVFNILVAPVFSAGGLTGERERQTLELLLTTQLTARQIIWGKLLAGFRVSYVLTMFLLWPLVLAFVLSMAVYGSNWLGVLTFFAIVFAAAVFNSVSALLCSAIAKKTSIAMLTSYSLLLLIYFLPVAAWYVGSNVSQSPEVLTALSRFGVPSPLLTCFWVPLDQNIMRSAEDMSMGNGGDWWMVLSYFSVTAALAGIALSIVYIVLGNRWGITGR
jgi:ABC-type transport system involved in multi-copper enzyme maturation permease subunit